jgi:hypothetical protein
MNRKCREVPDTVEGMRKLTECRLEGKALFSLEVLIRERIEMPHPQLEIHSKMCSYFK